MRLERSRVMENLTDLTERALQKFSLCFGELNPVALFGFRDRGCLISSKYLKNLIIGNSNIKLILSNLKLFRFKNLTYFFFILKEK